VQIEVNTQVTSGGKAPGKPCLAWPAQPTTKPRAPHASSPTGTHHIQARWLSGKKKVLKKSV